MELDDAAWGEARTMSAVALVLQFFWMLFLRVVRVRVSTIGSLP